MTAQLHMSKLLRKATDNQETVAVEGKTIGECLEDLVSQYPNVHSLVFDEEGLVRKYVLIFLNHKNTYPEEMKMSVKHGDDIHLEIFIDGG